MAIDTSRERLNEFYERLKDNFLDYYAVFDDMGIGEEEGLEMIENGEYKRMIERAKGVMRIKMRAGLMREALVEGKVSAMRGMIGELEDDSMFIEFEPKKAETRGRKKNGVNSLRIGETDDKLTYGAGE